VELAGLSARTIPLAEPRGGCRASERSLPRPRDDTVSSRVPLLHRKCQEAVMDKIEIPADETVPLDSIATGIVGLRILFVNAFAVAGENPTRR
jgi:hypothetical protein